MQRALYRNEEQSKRPGPDDVGVAAVLTVSVVVRRSRWIAFEAAKVNHRTFPSTDQETERPRITQPPAKTASA